MTIKLGINGFGRIGRNVFRAMLPNDNGEAIPLLAAGQSTGFYSFKIAKHADWQKTPIKAIAFVQNLQTDEVINAGTEGTFATGIEGGIDPGVRIAPNPATDYVSIDWASEILPSATLSLIDMQGRVLDQQEDIRPGHRINTTSIPAGIYAIKLSQGADSWAKKVVIR